MTALPQHMQALATANETRLARAEVRREVGALSGVDGRARLADLIETTPACLENMPVAVLLTFAHRVRSTQAKNILASLRAASEPSVAISETRTVKSLTARERRALVRYLRGDQITESRWAA